jgi:hypothetical protein
MSQLLYGCDDYVADWTAERIPHMNGRGFGPCGAIGVTSGDRLIAGIVFHNYQPDYHSIEASMAAESPMWARPLHMARILGYPFRQLGCWMCYTTTPIDGLVIIKINEHLGFVRKTIFPHALGRKRHAILCQMTQPEFEARHGRMLDGKKQSLAPESA